MTQTPTPKKARKSLLVSLALAFLILSVIMALSAIVWPLLAPIAMVEAVAAVTFSVLSLREL